ncbi:hypothetical protein D0Z07_1636 [Hyphodiscus hymeniophilus]|uniref:Uncharacterized protein n=1 Tax=Hyphodiscus hymeniophilus TaxID=353542 RepID=A0A9P7AZT5_9HELO|nr:hypothetical protein D0Z07_1636 [Hyphodiscus hymeniophilus]
MIEIDHTAVPLPEPATPVLASYLLNIEEKQRTRFSARGDKIRSGCNEIDDHMLGGGFERGILVGISAEAGEGRLISLHLLSFILISHLSFSLAESSQPPKTRATIIDTTGSFPITLLAKILKAQILDTKTKTARQSIDDGNYAVFNNTVNEKEADDQVRRCLEMVAISRVFDIEGLWEVLGEVGKSSDSGAADDESMSDEDGVEIVIIDNMTHLINELFARKERSEAHTLLTTLSRALHTLTHTRNILTVLHNKTVSSISKTYETDPSIEERYPQRRNKPNQNPQSTSVFPSNQLKPALGQIFSQLPDLHLLVSALPKTRGDAQQHYGQEDDADFRTGSGIKEVQFCNVIEVLKDETPNLGSQTEEERYQRKFGGREQRWAAVEVSADGLALVDTFMAKGNMRGLGLEREKGRTGDVGSVAKLYGFGGRRV